MFPKDLIHEFLLFVLQLVTPVAIPQATPNIGNTFLAQNLTTTQGTILEAFATFVLVFVVHSVCDERRTDVKMIAPLAIGTTAAVCHLFAVSTV